MISASTTNHRDGFGLLGVLLLLTIATLGIFAVFVTMTPSRSTKSLDITTTRVAALRFAITNYRTSHGGASGSYPPTLSALITTDGVPCTAANTPATTATYLTLQGWCGPYIDNVFGEAATDYQNDGWEQPFLYSSTTNIITSCGPDQICGDGDDVTFNP